MSEVATIASAGGPGAPLYEAEHADFRESFATFLRREVKPAYRDWRQQGGVPRDVLRTCGEHGFLGMSVPEEHGGLGIDDPRFGTVIGEEAMLAGARALALLLTTHNDVVLPALLRAAPEEWKSNALPGMASGETLATVATGAIALEGAGKASRLSGMAEMVVGARDADVFLAVATRESAEPALAIVERGGEGVTVAPSDAPLGLEAAGLGTLHLDRAEALLLEDDPDQLAICHSLALATTALAGARHALAITIEYVAERRAFGQPIAAFQNTRRALASVKTNLEAGDALLDRALSRQLDGELDLELASIAKLFCTELYGRAVDTGLQLHGGYGYIMEYEISHAFADAGFWRLAGATNQRMQDTVARTLL